MRNRSWFYFGFGSVPYPMELYRFFRCPAMAGQGLQWPGKGYCAAQ